jgi:hypothetical protein
VSTNPRRMVDALVESGFWLKADGGFQVHDYAAIYPDDAGDKAQSEARRQQKRDAGRKGGLARSASLAALGITPLAKSDAPKGEYWIYCAKSKAGDIVKVGVTGDRDRRELALRAKPYELLPTHWWSLGHVSRRSAEAIESHVHDHLGKACEWLLPTEMFRTTAEHAASVIGPFLATTLATNEATNRSVAEALRGGVGYGVVDRRSRIEEKENVDQPFDVWFQWAWEHYPEARRSRGLIVQQAFVEQLQRYQGGVMSAWLLFQTNLTLNVTSHEWLVKGMAPSMTKYLTEGRWMNALPADAPVGEQLTTRTSRTLEAAARIMREG